MQKEFATDAPIAEAAASTGIDGGDALKIGDAAQKRRTARNPLADTAKRPIQPNGVFGKAFYNLLYSITSVVVGMLFPVRIFGANCVPRKGAFLLIANHESYLDPPLLGLTCYRRQLYYLAMAALFHYAPFRWLILSLGAVKIDREGNASAGIKASLGVLESGMGLVIFPEGGRSMDGDLQPLKSGVLLLLKRSKAPVALAAIAGAYHCWPHFKLLPVPRPLCVVYRPWKWPPGADDRTALADLTRTLSATLEEANTRWRRIGGRPLHAPRRSKRALPPPGTTITAYRE